MSEMPANTGEPVNLSQGREAFQEVGQTGAADILRP